MNFDALGLEPIGVPSSLETFTGTQWVQSAALDSSEAWGSISVLPGSRALSPSSIISLESLGIPFAQVQIVLSPSGISNLEAWGSIALSMKIILTMLGIPSAQAFGITVVVPPSPSWIQFDDEIIRRIRMAPHPIFVLLQRKGRFELLPPQAAPFEFRS